MAIDDGLDLSETVVQILLSILFKLFFCQYVILSSHWTSLKVFTYETPVDTRCVVLMFALLYSANTFIH